MVKGSLCNLPSMEVFSTFLPWKSLPLSFHGSLCHLPSMEVFATFLPWKSLPPSFHCQNRIQEPWFLFELRADTIDTAVWTTRSTLPHCSMSFDFVSSGLLRMKRKRDWGSSSASTTIL